MTGFEHTFVAIACIFISYIVGHRISYVQGYEIGFAEGVDSGVDAAMSSISKHYGIDFSYDVEIREDLRDDESED